MRRSLIHHLLTGAGILTLAGAPALFAGDWQYQRQDLRRDYNHVGRLNADIRSDRWRLHEDLEHGRYRDAARVRRDLRRDYAERNEQVRDIRRDERWR